MCVAMFIKGIWPIYPVVIHCIVDKQSKTNRLGEILFTIGWLTISKYNNIVHVKRLTLTGHGLAVRVLLLSLQHAIETKRQNIVILIVKSLEFNSHIKKV